MAKGVTLQLGECLASYDVTALFTAVPMDPALNIIKDLLEKDAKLSDRTVLSVQNIIQLLQFCLHNTYFSFQNKFCEQVEGVAMGSLVSPIVANLYMEHFERKAFWSAPNPSRYWFMFVDDTWVIQQHAHQQAFPDHISSIDQEVMFTVEDTQGNGAIPFLDTLVTPEADSSLSVTVYHKPTHTDQYLQWDIHHNLSTKYSIIGIHTHRAKTVCTRPKLFKKKLQHLREALVKCKYPNWGISRVQSKYINSNWEDNNNKKNLQDNNFNPSTNMDQTNQSRDNITNSQDTHDPSASTEEAPTRQKPSIGIMVIPYTQGVTESFKKDLW